jgi:hypothetical protein
MLGVLLELLFGMESEASRRSVPSDTQAKNRSAHLGAQANNRPRARVRAATQGKLAMQQWPAGLAATGALLSVFLLSLSLPIPDKAIAAKTLRLAAQRAPKTVVMSGNSVLSHTSRCDADRRTLAELIEDNLARGEHGGKLLNLGAPGQHFAENVNYLALALKQDNVDTALLMLAPYQLSEHEWPSLQTQLYMSLRASSELAVNSLSQRFAEGYWLTGGEPGSQGFSYRGTAYPDYQGIKGFFMREKAAMGCPETLGMQRSFIEAYYWYEFAGRKDVDSNFDDVQKLAALARSLHKQLLVVLMPADAADASALNPEVGAAMKAHLRAITTRLQRAGVSPLDLSERAAPEDFADRWCACGHLSQQGRKLVADQVTSHLSSTH